jgi:hypothetical protein
MDYLSALRDQGLRVGAEGGRLVVGPRAALTEAVRTTIRINRDAIIRELAEEEASLQREASAGGAPPLSPAQEAARRQVLADLQANPNVKRAFFTRIEDGALINTLAIRDVGTCELLIPAERFDSSKLGDYATLLECFTVNES